MTNPPSAPQARHAAPPTRLRAAQRVSLVFLSALLALGASELSCVRATPSATPQAPATSGPAAAGVLPSTSPAATSPFPSPPSSAPPVTPSLTPPAAIASITPASPSPTRLAPPLPAPRRRAPHSGVFQRTEDVRPRPAPTPSRVPVIAPPTVVPGSACNLTIQVLDRGLMWRPKIWNLQSMNTPWVIVDPYTYEQFWHSTHPRKPSSFDAGAADDPRPQLDFKQQLIVVMRGRSGSSEIRTLSAEMHADHVMLTYANPILAELINYQDHVPFEAVVISSPVGTVRAQECRASEQFRAIAERLPTLYTLPGGRPRDLDLRTLDEVRKSLAAEGRSLLKELANLQEATTDTRQKPYLTLLEGLVHLDLMRDSNRALQAFTDVVTRARNTPLAQAARHRIHQIRNVPLEAATLRSLDLQRTRLAAARDRSPGIGRVWLELGAQYEYLHSTRPRSLYLAAECFREGARDLSDPDNVQNCLLRAAGIYHTYLNRETALSLYGECVRRYPEALSVPGVLKKMRSILLDRGDARGYDVYSDYLRRYPSSRRAADVQKLAGGR